MLPRAAPLAAAGRPPARKDLPGTGVLSWIPGWDGAWGGRGYAARVETGYRRNPVAFRCVRLIAECAASVPLRLVRAGAAVAHPVHERLLRRPNPAVSGTAFFDRLYTMLLLAGEAYLLRLPEERADDPQEFHLLPPERIRREDRGRGPWPARYVLEGEDGRRVFALDPLTGRGAVLHLVEPHPRDPLSPLARAEVAADAVDIHNAAQTWNKALLDNAARPSGAFVVEARDGAPASLSEAQFARLKADIEALFQGARNAGRPLLLEGGLKWQPMAFSPADMDFINLKHTAARDIALAFGVPPMLLGIPGDNTYSNYQEANRAFWRLTVLPLLRRVADELTAWLADALPADARLEPDRDEIARRTGERDSFWRELDQLSFLTAAEKRQLAGIEGLLAATGSHRPSAPAGVPADVETRHMHWRTEPRTRRGHQKDTRISLGKENPDKAEACAEIKREIDNLYLNIDSLRDQIRRIIDDMNREAESLHNETRNEQTISNFATLLSLLRDAVSAAEQTTPVGAILTLVARALDLVRADQVLKQRLDRIFTVGRESIAFIEQQIAKDEARIEELKQKMRQMGCLRDQHRA